ncbi:SDR family oxidoreductase [Sphingomonas naphthae]|uniref:SDR family oxidoreductase n=1 Tax=Sphingomonas naphthae TaxID=1813468 RepID=A0ABY7TMN6_9SPHN|nr:SDR family oxidoreductase [Sphingomonas naphthae]WCT74482.1 SDR family oxidoreductase [Sphingomonas naphthae]
MSLTLPLDGKRALVTGAATGIGRATAVALAAQGAAVIINCRDEAQCPQAEAVVAQIEAAGGWAKMVVADVEQVAAIRSLFAMALETCGGLDLVVSNAAGNAAIKPVADTSEAEYDRVTALNARSQFFVMQEAARALTNGGRIIVLSSSSVAGPYAGTAGYGGAKRAAEIHARVLAYEVAARGITVNIVAPGPTDTETMQAQTSPARKAEVAKMIPLGRLGKPDDIADVITFLASDGGRWMTGQIVQVGGGIQ